MGANGYFGIGKYVDGCIIFGTIRKSVMFMLCTNVAEVIAVALAADWVAFFRLSISLLPPQILYLNVIADVFPALFLVVGEGEPDLMHQTAAAGRGGFDQKALVCCGRSGPADVDRRAEDSGGSLLSERCNSL